MAWTTISTIRGDVSKDRAIVVREEDYGNPGLILRQDDGQVVYVSRRQMGKLKTILEMQLQKIDQDG